MAHSRILIADDDPDICSVLKEIVEELGHEVVCKYTATEAVNAVVADQFDIVLLDLKFPDCRDFSALREIREKSPDTDVIIVTAEADNLNTVTEAVRLGAFDYVPKPIRDDDIKIRVTRLLQMRELSRSNTFAIGQLAKGSRFEDIVGVSPAITRVVEQTRELAYHDAPVLITGETGTGKELVAKVLHYEGARKLKPFISINCAALPRELTESELFGHEKGSFTGADARRKGAIEEVRDGTLFLDEIGDMNTSAQAVLLRVLDSGEYHSVGGKLKRSLARFVLATNQDLDTLINQGMFRKDLFYRVDRMRVHLPALRDRKEDIPLLARHFLKTNEEKIGKGMHGISDEVMSSLTNYSWPGNVRELRNEIERAYMHARDEMIRPIDLSAEVLATQQPGEDAEVISAGTIEDLHKLVEALRTNAGSITKTAKALGIHRNTVYRWIKKYSLGNLLEK